MQNTIDIQLVRNVREASRELAREWNLLNGRFGPHQLSSTRCHALIETGRKGSITIAELAERLRLDKSTTSRTVSKLREDGFVKVVRDDHDQRQKFARLTAEGEKELHCVHQNADSDVAAALGLLNDEEYKTVLEGMELYAKALKRSRIQKDFVIRPIEPKDNPAIAKIIFEVMTEFGAVGPGYSIQDDEVSNMFDAYKEEGFAFFVIEKEGKILGGSGVGPLQGGGEKVCELRKNYLLPEARGLGMGKKLMNHCLQAAKKLGYTHCYLETISSMAQARLLYEKAGFQKRDAPLGNTGHFSCEDWYEMAL